MIPRHVRDAVMFRAQGRCEDCGGGPDWRGFHFHHVILKGMGGSKKLDTEENLVQLCGRCHSKRHGIREV